MCRMQIFCRRSVSMLLTMMAMATITTIKMTKMLTMTMMKEKMKKKRKANIVERNSRAPSSCRPFIYQDRIPLPQSSVWYFFVFYCCICVFVCWFVSYFIDISTAFSCLPPCLPRSISVAYHFSVLLYLWICVLDCIIFHVRPNSVGCLPYYLARPLHFIALHFLCIFIFLHLRTSAIVYLSFCVTI